MNPADVYRSRPGYRYSVASHHSGPGTPIPDRPGWFTPGPADYYFLTCGNSLDDAFPRRHFKTSEAAQKAACKLNDADVIASLDVPGTHQQRFDRFRALTEDERRWWWGDSHPLARLPRTPGRYAVEEWYDNSSGWDTYETLEEVREQLLGGDVNRVVDLDTGEDVPFKLAAVIGDEVAAMREP